VPSADHVHLRDATADDVAAIAALHADSWRRHYRGSLDDDYLDHAADADRLAVWTERFADPDRTTTTATVIASPSASDRTVLGFAHTVFDADPTWGSLLDNLHVTADRKGGGIGTQLLAETARRVVDRTGPSTTTGLYLWVLERNTAAQAFYRARGAIFEDHLPKPQPGGTIAVGIRCVWPDPSVLLRPPM
jgi:ribosomal protein S18 acetylase RimI-like enzyme